MIGSRTFGMLRQLFGLLFGPKKPRADDHRLDAEGGHPGLQELDKAIQPEFRRGTGGDEFKPAIGAGRGYGIDPAGLLLLLIFTQN